MLKRILIISFFTGIGQLAMIFSIKFAAKFLNNQQLASIAQIDALVVFLISLIAFGLQSAAMRNILVSNNWRDEYYKTQSARLTFGVILLPLGIFSVVRQEYLTFFLAPLLALSGDYALYSIGKPIVAAFMACIRLLVPYLSLLAASYYESVYTSYIFLLSWVSVYFISNTIIASILSVPVLFKPGWKFLKLYYYNISLGIVSTCFYILGLGVILIIPYFYPYDVQGIAFIGLKFYVLYKGILRIIHQAFFKELMYDEWCYKVDQLSALIAIVYLSSIFFFPASFIRLFFGEKQLEYKSFFWLLAIGAAIYSLMLSATTKALIDKQDNLYARISLVASLITIAGTVAVSFIKPTVFGMGLSLCVGELAFLLGLVKISNLQNLVITRLRYFLLNCCVMIVPITIHFFFGDNISWLIINLCLVSFLLYLSNYKVLKASI